jgi:hypothetical protein
MTSYNTYTTPITFPVMVESLQSQVKQLQETIRSRKHRKTTSVKKKY